MIDEPEAHEVEKAMEMKVITNVETETKFHSKTVFLTAINGCLLILILITVILDSNSCCVGTMPNLNPEISQEKSI